MCDRCVCVCVTGVLCVWLWVSVCICDRCVGVTGLCVCVTGVCECTPWTVACQSSLSFLRKNPGVGCHFLLQGILQPGSQPSSPTLQVDSLLQEAKFSLSTEHCG